MSASNETKRIAQTDHEQSGGSLGVAVRRLVLFGGPLDVAIATWFHPHADDVYTSLSPVADEVGLDGGTVSDHLQRAERNLLTQQLAVRD